ncbi:cell wall metabolism sensor histidine kinase WalK [Paenibacillus sp. L3-i20]|uniref:sensor histidine kinase n=1 Tax=Paenibacillus sp. L3-i20 TaxID=2905833 RepID=UPI001EDCCD82|nr:HAMP domain-containing sensor histidine kinase [Paenibacillus sp. L3-i20]GKU79023.1 two-component sensor histidine kinase [Paenibacillus sp. L3-i20]
MSKYRSIAFKIFVLTSLVLVAFALLLYVTLYFILPSFYFQNKSADLNQGITRLLKTLPQEDWTAAVQSLDDFSIRYNALLFVQDSSGKSVYAPFITQGHSLPLQESVTTTEKEGTDSTIIISDPDNLSTHLPAEPEMISYTNLPLPGYESRGYTLSVLASLQPIDEAARMLLRLLPYMALIILVIAILGALVYTRLIARPLIGISQVAKRLAQLDFSERSRHDSRDEIGDISRSLNDLSMNLQQAMQELTEANMQLKDDIQRKEEDEALRREFMDMISHELKTPITAVSGQLEAMLHNVGPYSNRDKYLAQSQHILKEMEKLVYEILDISRLENHRFQPSMAAVNVSALIQEAAEQIQYICELNGIRLESNLASDQWVTGDKRLLSKAISNVMSNAVHYTRSGEQIRIALYADAGHVCLSVLNTGAFIEPNEIPKLFKPFYRIEKSRSRRTGGSGLGLYIVNTILNIHQSEYSLSNTGEGVLFSVRWNTNN